MLKLTVNFNLKTKKREKLNERVSIFSAVSKHIQDVQQQPAYYTTNLAGNISLVLYLYKQLEKQNRSTTTQKKIKYRCSSSMLLKFFQTTKSNSSYGQAVAFNSRQERFAKWTPIS